MTKRKAMLLDEHTYGYYYPDTNEFSCTHGAWSSDIKLIDETTCELKVAPSVTEYKFVDEIPEGWDYT